jgi:hypothetical protein
MAAAKPPAAGLFSNRYFAIEPAKTLPIPWQAPF